MYKRLTGVLLALTLICMAAPAMAQPTPFVIRGYATDLDLQPVDNPNMTVTNLSTGKMGCSDNCDVELLPARALKR